MTLLPIPISVTVTEVLCTAEIILCIYLVQRRPHSVAVVRLEEPREGHLVAAAPRRREDSAVGLHGTLEFAPAIAN